MPEDHLAQYRQVQAKSASPMQHVAMLYRAALENVRRCRKLRSEGLYIEGGKEAAKAQSILTELMIHLDKRGGDLTQLFMDQYQSIYLLVSKGQLEKDDEALEAAQDLLEKLLETWELAMKNIRKDYYGP